MRFTQSCSGGRVARDFSRAADTAAATRYSPMIANEISAISCPGDMEDELCDLLLQFRRNL